MKDILRICLLGMMLSIFTTACDVHEFPGPPEPEPLACQLTLVLEEDDYDFHDNVIIGEDANRSRSLTIDGTHDLRYIVRVYPYISDRGDSRVSPTSVMDYHSSTMPFINGYEALTVPLKLQQGEYEIVAWADHVEPGSSDDLYHDTSDFMEIRLKGAGEAGYSHHGNEAHRVAWRGRIHILVDAKGQVAMFDAPGNPLSVVELPMDRPHARYHFITNDLAKFLEGERSRLGVEAKSGAEAPPMPAPSSPNLDDYTVVMRYTGYMPCAYNIFTDKPMDSAMGVTYEGNIRPLDTDHAELSFDHVLVNHNETSVQVSLELYRKADGTKLSSTGVVDVPLKRGRYTTVEGPMLTTTAGASMGIVPDFDGDYNIEIH